MRPPPPSCYTFVVRSKLNLLTIVPPSLVGQNRALQPQSPITHLCVWKVDGNYQQCVRNGPIFNLHNLQKINLCLTKPQTLSKLSVVSLQKYTQTPW